MKMTPERRKEHRARGLCIQCTRKSRPGKARCRVCAKAKAKSDAAAYQRKKLAGLCMYGGCKAPAENHLCPEHERRQSELHAAWMADPANKEAARGHRTKFYSGRKSRKRCRYAGCNDPLHTETACLKHALLARSRSEAIRRARGERPSERLCTNCRRPGHRADTCTGFYSESLDIDDFAASRPGASY